VTRGWRKLHNEELHDLYSSPRRVEEDEVGGTCGTDGEKRNGYRLVVGKPEGKRQLGRTRRKWMDNIMMALLEIGLGVADRIGLAQDRYRWRALVNAEINPRVP
jgi:hypothetical protein